jgi:hypothetical protein
VPTVNNHPAVIELSKDGKRIRCNICFEASEQNGNKWIKKESLSTHIASDIHTSSVDSQLIKESVQKAGEQSMREENAMEESMDFAILSSITQSSVTKRTSVPHLVSVEEQEMWDDYASSNAIFDAGIDPTLAAVVERKRLVEAIINLDIWHGTDFLPEDDPNNGEQLLDNLEQEDILTELLRNARTYISSFLISKIQNLSCLGVDLNAPDAGDLLYEEAQRSGQSKIPDTWSPYESKTVS